MRTSVASAQGLDETMLVLNDRIAGDGLALRRADRRMDGIEESIEGVDAEVDRRAQGEDVDGRRRGDARAHRDGAPGEGDQRAHRLAVRTHDRSGPRLQDATMDVSTAVQLDRLEEIERAVIELDPAQFVQGGRIKTQ